MIIQTIRKKIRNTFYQLSTDLGLEVSDLRMGIIYNEKDQSPLLDLWAKNQDPKTKDEHPIVPVFYQDEHSKQMEPLFLDLTKVIPLSSMESAGIKMATGEDPYTVITDRIVGNLRKLAFDKKIPLEKIRTFFYMQGEGSEPEIYLYNELEPICPINLEDLIEN